jgi:hypothetical protein
LCKKAPPSAICKTLAAIKMTRKKTVILTGFILAVITVYFAWEYYSYKLNSDIDKNSKSYKKGYNKVTDDLTKDGLDFSYPALADEYGALTIELVLAKDFGYRPINFSCVNQDWNYNAGLADAYIDFVKAKCGDDFMEKAKLKSEKIEEEFKIRYYRNNFEKIANNHFIKQWTKDSIEVGEFDLKWITETPFVLQYDTDYNKDYTDIKYSGDKMFFTAKTLYSDKKIIELPALAFTVYWKSDSKFPYKDIPFERIFLNSIKK